MTTEDQIAAWFPYGTYRPHQKDMLRAVHDAVSQGKTILINAPTGSGKSSTISAVLAATTVRPVVVAVRTVSQLNIFIRELQMIREKRQPGLKFAYVVGKGKVCRVYGEMGVNEKCKYIKKMSRDRIVGDDIQADLSGCKIAFDPMAPAFCPWFVASKQYDEDAGIVVDSDELCEKARTFSTTLVDPENIRQFAGNVCPYEVMRKAAYDSDVIIVNYQHVLNPAIRTALLGKFYKMEDKPVLICDEAHNVGSALEELHSIQIDYRTIERALEEHDRPAVRDSLGAEYTLGQDSIIPAFFEWMKEFIQAQDAKYRKEEVFEYQMVWKKMQESLTDGSVDPMEFLDWMYHTLEDHQTSVENKADPNASKEQGCPNLFKMIGFLLMLGQSMSGDDGEDMSIVKIFVKNDRGSALKLRNIDPSGDAVELMKAHGAMVLMSGTIHPPAVYGKYLFGDENADKLAFLSLPNVFPEENRKLVVCVDVTTTYKVMTSNNGSNENNRKIFGYIQEFIKIPGNLAVYFPSYSMMRDYQRMLEASEIGRTRKFYVESQDARTAADTLEEYISLPSHGKSGVLLAVSGGKYSEGIDYRGDTMVGVMVVGLPLAAYSPVMQAIIKYYERKFGSVGNFIAYTLPALNRAQQALGRVIRTETDRGFLVLCERRYLENLKSLPVWMKQEAERCVSEEFSDLVQEWNNG